MSPEAQRGLRIGSIIFVAGMLACGIGFLFPLLTLDTAYYKYATPFFFLAVALSLPTGALVAQIHSSDPLYIMLAIPLALAINAALIGGTVTAWHTFRRRVKRRMERGLGGEP